MLAARPYRAPSMIVVALALLLVAGLLTAALGTSSTAAAGTSGSLSVSPRTYVAGQEATFSGSLGRSGRRTIHLEQHMGRPGDSWARIEGFRTTTDSSGRFRFSYPAPAMFNIRYRVRSGAVATPSFTFRAKTQESLVTFSDRSPAPGQAFSVVVDTAPRVGGRQDLPPPVFPGRLVDLQERSGSSWRTVATRATDNQGQVAFPVTRRSPGVVTYRARQHDWLAGGSVVGWHPSFPASVRVTGTASTQAAPAAVAPLRDGRVVPLGSAATRGGTTNASQVYGWNPALFDFAWERGESLTSPPMRGNLRRGGWLDSSDGTGRVSHYNGGLLFDSQFGNRGGRGDRGTTTATLRGNAQPYGRWEFRTRSWSMENNRRDYRLRIQLVPEDPAKRHCGANDVTVAELADHSTRLKMGVGSFGADRSWALSRSGVRLGDEAHNVAVEIARGHISWFLDGRIIGTVADASAVSGHAMTPRISLVGDGGREMNRTKAIFDWVRAWTPANGRHPSNGTRLQAGPLGRTC